MSVTSKGADPTGAADSTAAFNAAIAAAGAGGTVWIPAGHVQDPRATSTGQQRDDQGRRHVALDGRPATAPGFYGNVRAATASTNVHLSDFAIFGNVQERNDGDQVNGIGGALSNSTVDRVWIEHTKVGAWMDGPMDNLVVQPACGSATSPPTASTSTTA